MKPETSLKRLGRFSISHGAMWFYRIPILLACSTVFHRDDNEECGTTVYLAESDQFDLVDEAGEIPWYDWDVSIPAHEKRIATATRRMLD